MLPFKKILCPTDFSSPSFEAIKAATELARHFSANLLVVHVVQPVPAVVTGHMTPTTFNVPAYQQEMEAAAAKIMEEETNKLIPKDISSQTTLLLGDPANEILSAAENEKADLIVIATRGQTGLKRLVFGSVAEKVIRHATVPVLSIRDQLPEA